jgi:hypothetical protein
MRPVALSIHNFSGGRLQEHDTFEGHLLPEPLASRRVRPGEAIRADLRVDSPATRLPYIELQLDAFAGSFLCGQAPAIYQARACLLFDLVIELNGQEIFRGGFYLRNHPDCDPIQQHALRFRASSLPLHAGQNTLVIRNRTGDRPFPSMRDLHVTAARWRESTGRLINHLHTPDALDRYLDAHPDPSLLSGVGYELELRRDLPQMIDDLAHDRAGNYLMIRPDTALNDGTLADPREVLGWVERLVQHGIYFSIMFFRAQGHCIDRALMRQIQKRAGEYLVSLNHHELGLVWYGGAQWRRTYLRKPVNSLADARDAYVEITRRRVRDELPRARGVVASSEASVLTHLNLQAGIELPLGELFPQHCGLVVSSIRGAARVYQRDRWGAHFALLWSLGNGVFYGWDQAKARRFGLAVRLAYLAGARVLYPESGLFAAIAGHLPRSSRRVLARNSADSDAPVQQQMRQAMREPRRLHAIHQLPADPHTDVAFMQGHLDPFAFRRAGGAVMDVAGLADEQADRGWGLLEVMMPNALILGDDAAAHDRWFAGSPLGQCDLVPASADADRLRRYRLLVVPGWNTLTAPIERQWLRYLRGGGTLVACAAQLRSDTRAGEVRSLLHDGDLRKLFGVRLGRLSGEVLEVVGRLPGERQARQRLVVPNQRLVHSQHLHVPHTVRCQVQGARVLLREAGTGEPVLVEHRVGRGRALLFTTHEYLGHPLLLPLARRLIQNLIAGLRRPLTVQGPPSLQHFVYRDGPTDRVALIDTDWTDEAGKCTAVIGAAGVRARVDVPAHGLRWVFHRAGLLATAGDQYCCIQVTRHTSRRTTLRCRGWTRHEITLIHPGRRVASVQVDGVEVACRARGERTRWAGDLHMDSVVQIAWRARA